MTLKIERASQEECVTFALSGRIETALTAELQKLIDLETENHNVVLDLREVQLVDQDTVRFLARCEAVGIKLENCPAYIREWIAREGEGK
ncbi:MAG: hypothetical protein ACREOO_16765 [bacterium]